MKKLAGILCVLVFALAFAVEAKAQEVDRKVFIGAGTFQKFVNFPFRVPWGNCGTGSLEVYQYVPSEPFFGVKSEWKKLFPGEMVPAGFYRFVNHDLGCATRFSLCGEISEVQQIEAASLIEIEPQDVGMFVEGVRRPRNVLGLPDENDAYSYDLVMPHWGVNISLGALLKDEVFTSSQKIVGVILADRRGFLKHRIWGRKNVLRQAKKVWISPDDITIVVYYEKYR